MLSVGRIGNTTSFGRAGGDSNSKSSGYSYSSNYYRGCSDVEGFEYKRALSQQSELEILAIMAKLDFK